MFSHLLKYMYMYNNITNINSFIILCENPYFHLQDKLMHHTLTNSLLYMQLHHLFPCFLNNSHSTYHTANLKHNSPIIHIATHVKTTDLKQTLENPLVALLFFSSQLILMFNASHFLKEWICICQNVLDILHFEGLYFSLISGIPPLYHIPFLFLTNGLLSIGNMNMLL